MSNETPAAPAAPLTEEERNAQSAARAQEHKAKFAATADDGQPTAAVTPEPNETVHEKPEHVPEKFWNKDTGEVNYEAWNSAHAALESKFHSGSKKDTDAESEETPADDKDAGAGDSSEETTVILETPAAQTAAANYAEHGELSDSDYAALEKQGINRDMVDAYIAGQEARANVLTGAAYEPAGGQERYAEMITWATENLDQPSIKAFNTQVQSGDPDVIRNAVTALNAVYSEEAPVEGKRVGGAAPSTNSSTFASRREMTAAINKIGEDGRRLYDVDPGYRTDVQRKIGASRRAGTFTF